MQQINDYFSNMKPPPYNRQKGFYFHGLLSTPDCRSCPLQNDTKVYPDGPVPARLAVVAEEPGSTELQEGRGLIGPSGKLFWQLCESVGIKREDVWVTNASLCIARRVKLTSGAVLPHTVVKAMAAKACRLRLIQELIAVDPAVIIPVGNWALWALSDIANAKIYSYRGSRLDIDLASLAERVSKGLANSPMKSIKDSY
jgi:uracil-DNA glycosylase family 4